MKRFILFLLILSAAQDILAQKAEVRSGNKLYQERKFTEAAAAYQSALQKNPTYAPAIFNLGTAQYQQKNFGGARQSFTNTAKVAKDRNVKADAHYNIGNSYMEEKEWEKAIEEYKEALRSNPQDEAAKYNLSYAKAMLKKQEGQGGGKDEKNKDKNEGENEDKKDQGDNKEENDKDGEKKPEDQGKDGEEKKDEQNKDGQKPQPQPSKLSEQQAEQLLNALSQEEKALHDKKEKARPGRMKNDKDW